MTTVTPKIKLIKAVKPSRPKWLVCLYGPSMGGKTLLTTQLEGGKLVFDPTGNYMDQAREDSDVYLAFENPADNARVQNITAACHELLPDPTIQVVIADNFTMTFQDLVDQADAMPKSGPGSREGKTHKAKQMKALRRAIFGYNKHVIFVYHVHIHGDGQTDAKIEGRTVSDIELARFNMFTNLTLRMVREDKGQKRYGVFVERDRLSGGANVGRTIYDQAGNWTGFWEYLYTELYGNMTMDEMIRNVQKAPTVFAGLPEAYSYGFEQGCFGDVNHAKGALTLLAETNDLDLSDPDDYSAAWVAEIDRRVAALVAAVGTDKSQWPAELKRMAAAKAKSKRATAPTAPEPDIIAPAPEDIIKPSPWLSMQARLTDDHRVYISQVIKAAGGDPVTPAQAHALRQAVAAAGGWGGAGDGEIDEISLNDWVINILTGRREGSTEQLSTGAFKFLATQIVKQMGDRVNPKYDANVVSLVRSICDVVADALGITPGHE